jgi:hypothetical protein
MILAKARDDIGVQRLVVDQTCAEKGLLDFDVGGELDVHLAFLTITIPVGTFVPLSEKLPTGRSFHRYPSGRRSA